MRLINISTLTALTLEDFIGDNVPPYGILSHTWDKEEVSFQAFSGTEARSLLGYKKIQGFCAQAAEDGLSYVWVDTCCIDKSSSAELSEAINSMYRWYANAKCCYVYLSDLETSLPDNISSREWVEENFDTVKNCRWFKRGWTLQELLAPDNIKFYNQQWTWLGTKFDMCDLLTRATGIKLDHLWKRKTASVAQKMSWAAHRVTTRIEDSAYCLLGIFDVNMPLLYGEGKKAFMRLQQEILRSSHDESLFAWTNERLWTCGLLAESPADFAGSSNIVPCKSKWKRRPYSMTNHGLQIELRRVNLYNLDSDIGCFQSPLLCKYEGHQAQIVLYFNKLNNDLDEDHVVRTAPFELGLSHETEHSGHEVTSFFVQDITLLKQQPQRLIKRELSETAPLTLRLSGLVDKIRFSGIHEMPADNLGLFIADLATPTKLVTTYLCWHQEVRDHRALDVYRRDFDLLRKRWQHMDEWLSHISTQAAKPYKLRTGHPCAMWDGTSLVTLIAVRPTTSQGLVLDIQVDNFTNHNGFLRSRSDIQMDWIGRSPFPDWQDFI